MTNCHYVPRFIQKRFGQSLDAFNVKTQEIRHGTPIEGLFSQEDFYPYWLEKKFNERSEQPFSMLLPKLLNPSKEIVMNRKELQLLKKFLLLEMLRCPSELMTAYNGRQHSKEVAAYSQKGEELIKNNMGKYITELDSEEKFTDYWHRTLDCILEMDDVGSQNVYDNPSSTYDAWHFSKIIESGYQAFWDASDTTDEFIITDEGMVSEKDRGVAMNVDSWQDNFNLIKEIIGSDSPIVISNKTKELLAQLELAKKADDENYIEYLLKMLYITSDFNENFMMFHLSPKRMVVLINSYFQFFNSCPNLLISRSMTDYSRMDIRCFPINRREPPANLENLYDKNTRYIYSPVKLKQSEVEYCNALWMDRAYNWIASSSFVNIRRSIARYKVEAAGQYRNDYTELYNELNIN